MYRFCRRGLRPRPSAGTGETVANGLVTNDSTLVKNAATPISTATTTGISSRFLRRFVTTTSTATIDSSHIHSSSDPAWLPHSAVILYRHPRVRLE